MTVTIQVDGQSLEVESSDPRAQGVVLSAAQQNANARNNMVVDRWAFASAAMSAGIITAAEAQAWGPGNSLPTTIDAALSAALTDPDALNMAKVRALAAPRIRRTNPLIEILRVAFSLTEQQADALFVSAQLIQDA